MSSKAMQLHSVFKQWYRDPKYCNYNITRGISYSFIKKQGFNDTTIAELLNNNIIEEYMNKSYRLTQEAIKDYMMVN